MSLDERRGERRSVDRRAAPPSVDDRFLALVDATSDIVWTANPDGTLRPSASWEHFTGQSEDEYAGPGMGGFDAVHPEDRDALGSAWVEVLADPRRMDTTYRMRRRDGEYRRVQSTTIPILDEDGTLREWVGAATDVEDELTAREELARQSRLTETITENATSALFLMDADGRPTYMNTAAEEMFGYKVDEIRHLPLHDVVHHTRPDGTPYPMEECPIDRALPEQRWLEPYEDRFIKRDGTFIPVRAAASPILRDGTPVGTVVEVQDMSEQHALLEGEREARLRAELLERSATRLAAAMSVDEVAEAALADLDALGLDGGAVRLLRGDTIRVVGSVGVLTAVAHRFSDVPAGEDGSVSGRAIAGGRATILGTRAELEAMDPGIAAYRDLGIESAAAIPLRAGDGTVIGAFTVVSRTPHWVSPGRRQLVAGLADQCGLALERALLQAEVTAASARSAFLARLAGVLDRHITAGARIRNGVDLMHRHLGVPIAIHLHDDRHVALRVATDPPPSADLRDPRRWLVPDPTTPTGRDAGIHRLDDDVRVAPLTVRGRPLGALVVGDTTAATTTGADIELDDALVLEIATRLGLAVDNALLYEQERDVSHTLQLGLLSDVPDRVENAQVSYTYRPGTDTLEVGGDWYDVFPLPDGRIALAVGDVVGHGLDAAVAMGQLRGAVRALAQHDGPAEVARRLDHFVRHASAAEMATLALGEFNPATGEVRFACAGHPPPLHVDADGGCRYLWDGRSAPLGCTISERTEATVRLAPGDTLLVYTDGLIERRGEVLDEGLQRLQTAVAGERGFDPDLAGRLVDRILEASGHDDDICVLAIRYSPTPAPFRRAFPAVAGELSVLRRELDAWLAEAGADAMCREEVILAVSEAAANAIEHGYGFRQDGVTTVIADADPDGVLRITVEDRGTWRTPVRSPERGRGTPIMHHCMDEVRVERSGRGTTVEMVRRLGGTRSRPGEGEG